MKTARRVTRPSLSSLSSNITLPSNAISRSPLRSSSFVSRNSGMLIYGSRGVWTQILQPSLFQRVSSSRLFPWLVGSIVAGATSLTVFSATTKKTDWETVRSEIKSILVNESHDDGHYGPILVRLAWHAAGTYCHHTKTGGSNGATMRFAAESAHGANKGLHIARELLEKVKQKHPEVSYADLWTLAGCVAIEEMGGPHIPWRSGRADHADETRTPPEGRLPDASKDRHHVREIFNRMGFSDREIVALLGAHCIGRCHTDRSGYHGPWTTAPTTFTNDFFVHLLNEKWTEKKWNGPKQYEDETGTLMMLPTDMELMHDPDMRRYVEQYAADEKLFFKDFAGAFSKLLELGVEFPTESLASAPLGGKPSGNSANAGPVSGKQEEKSKGWFGGWLGGGDKKH